MDEFIFVLLAGLLMIAVMLIAWGVPPEGAGNATQGGVTKIENPFSIGSFPKDVARQISFGDFKVSYSLGSTILETKRSIEIDEGRVFSMGGIVEQDISMLTGGFINIFVRETNSEGKLIVKVNGQEVFNQMVNPGKIEIPLSKEIMREYNTVEITTKKNSALKFWVKSSYKIDRIDFGANFYGNLGKDELFQIYPEELRNFRSAELGFRLKSYSGAGDLSISINNRRIFKGQPSLDFHQSFNQYEAGLSTGANTISFSTEAGSTYELENVVISIIRTETAKKSRTFDFTVTKTDYGEKLRGLIKFYISDTDNRGNLILTITDSSGKVHPLETIQSYSIGQTKTVEFDDNEVDVGVNKLTFEVGGEGNFVISNVEIMPR